MSAELVDYEIDGLTNVADLLSLFVGDLHAEVVLQSHQELDNPQRVDLEILLKAGIHRDLVTIDSQLVDQKAGQLALDFCTVHSFLLLNRQSTVDDDNLAVHISRLLTGKIANSRRNLLRGAKAPNTYSPLHLRPGRVIELRGHIGFDETGGVSASESLEQDGCYLDSDPTLGPPSGTLHPVREFPDLARLQCPLAAEAQRHRDDGVVVLLQDHLAVFT